MFVGLHRSRDEEALRLSSLQQRPDVEHQGSFRSLQEDRRKLVADTRSLVTQLERKRFQAASPPHGGAEPGRWLATASPEWAEPVKRCG